MFPADIIHQANQPGTRNLVFQTEIERLNWIGQNRHNLTRGQILFVRDPEQSFWWDGVEAKELSSAEGNSVRLAGDQIVGGNKTFSNPIRCDTFPTNNSHLANKLYVDVTTSSIYPVHQYQLKPTVDYLKCENINEEGIWIDKTGPFRYLLINGKIKTGTTDASRTEEIVTLGPEFTPDNYPMRGDIIAFNGVVRTANENKPVTGAIDINAGIISITLPPNCAVNDRVWATAVWIGA